MVIRAQGKVVVGFVVPAEAEGHEVSRLRSLMASKRLGAVLEFRGEGTFFNERMDDTNRFPIATHSALWTHLC